MAIKKIPCGGFYYDDEQIKFEDGVIKVIGGSGGGLEYDFIIVTDDGETYRFEKGSYNSIVSKIKTAPVVGIARVYLDEYMQYSTNQIMNIQHVCVDFEEDTWILGVVIYGAEGEFQLIIQEDNTIITA